MNGSIKGAPSRLFRARILAAEVTPALIDQWRREGRRPAKKANGDWTVLVRESEIEKVPA